MPLEYQNTPNKGKLVNPNTPSQNPDGWSFYGKKVIYTEAFLNREDAEIARDLFLEEYLDDISTNELYLNEDEVKFINAHYVVRIMIGSKQQDFGF